MDRRKLLLVVAAVVAALGVALVFVYARGADARAADKFDTVEVLVAKKKINPGETFDEALESGKIEKTDVAQAQVLDGAGESTGALDGKLALTTIYPGEQLIPTKFGGAFDIEAAATLPIPENKIAISILVNDDGRVGKFLAPGAEVSIIFTDIDRTTQEPALTETLLERVTVLAAGSTTSLAGDDGNEDGSAEDSAGAVNDDAIQQLLTIAVSQQEAERVRFAEKDGELTAALINDASDVDTNDPITKDNLLKSEK